MSRKMFYDNNKDEMENQKYPEISIIIPCRNEEEFIGRCLESLVSNGYPSERMEVLVVDGSSEDNTRNIVEEYMRKFEYIRLLENPDKITPKALNIGVRNANGEIIFIVSAHAEISFGYLVKCVEYLSQGNADNVGGILLVKPRINSLISEAIALTFSHPFGSGNAYYKTGTPMIPKDVDTVPFGCYRRDVFERIGLFNEKLKRSQDIEFNTRLRKAGGRILLVPDIYSIYYVRSDLPSYFKHNFQDGLWAIYPYIFVDSALRVRHFIPAVFVGSLVSSAILGVFWRPFRYVIAAITIAYTVSAGIFSMQIARKNENAKLLPLCVLAFATRHFGYGLGSMFAIPKTLIYRIFKYRQS